MKTCPVCGDATFDDQPVCYGCLHRFGDDAERVQHGPASEKPSHARPPKPATVFEFGQAAGFGDPDLEDGPELEMQAASFLVSFGPSRGKGGAMGLTCTITPVESSVSD